MHRYQNDAHRFEDWDLPYFPCDRRCMVNVVSPPPPLPAGTINCKLSRHSAAVADAEACIQKHPKFPGGWKCKAIAEKEGGNVSLIDCRGFSSALGLFTRYLRSSKLRAAMHNW